MTDDNPRDLATGIVGFVGAHGLNALPAQMAKAGISPYDALADLAREVVRLSVYYETIESIALYVAGDGSDPQRVALADGIREGRRA